MKVLVTTARMQDARDNDYNWCIESTVVEHRLVVREMPGDYDLRQLGDWPWSDADRSHDAIP